MGTAMTTYGHGASGSSAVPWLPSPGELDDLDLLLNGAYAPLTGFLSADNVASVRKHGALLDGSPWPVPVTLHIGPGASEKARGADELVLHDDEGAPIARLQVTDRSREPDGSWLLGGPVAEIAAPAWGRFRRLRRSPAQVRTDIGDGPVIAAVIDDVPLPAELGALDEKAAELGARVLLLIAVGASTRHREFVVRVTLAVLRTRAATLATGVATVVLIGVPDACPAGRYSVIETDRRALIAGAYGATYLVVPGGTTTPAPGRAAVAPHVARVRLSVNYVRTKPVDDAASRVGAAVRPPLQHRGVTVLFTGLSGSGKSTVARGLADALLERSDRTVTLLDGDVVRRMLSAGLTFSRADRDHNVDRIGYVAAEVTRHGGVAICAPIAPYAATRASVRKRVSDTGEFILVYVSTPLAVCEQRDRKGLYVKARAGEIAEFTGISDPYEVPVDADLVLDTSIVALDVCVERVLGLLIERGLVWTGV